MHELGQLDFASEDYEKAVPLLLDTYDGHRTKLSPGHPHTISSLRSLVTLCEAKNKPDEVAQWRAKLLRGRKDQRRVPGHHTLRFWNEG